MWTLFLIRVKILNKTLHHSLFKDYFPDENVSYKDLRTNIDLGISWFSDTILIY